MMELLQQIDLGALLLICGGLCVLGVIATVVLPIVSTLFGIVFSFADVLVELVSAGPVSGCGCVVAAVVCGGCALVVAFAASVLSTCGTPEAVNFCVLFGR